MTSEVDLNFDYFIQNPSCLWNFNIIKKLVELKWAALKSIGILSEPSEYNTARILSRNQQLATNRLRLGFGSTLETYLEDHSNEYIDDFYFQNGLSPLAISNLMSVKKKLEPAISLFDYPDGPLNSINLLVRSIHVVKQNDLEIDISHSDPKIPFSIFISVCDDVSPISNLRVAESILHEAMHLKLTLLESVVPLVKSNAKQSFYSPWKDQIRPTRGVLHGLFVFKSVLNFHENLRSIKPESDPISNYLECRQNQILSELDQLRTFVENKGLTANGANLVRNLLPSN